LRPPTSPLFPYTTLFRSRRPSSGQIACSVDTRRSPQKKGLEAFGEKPLARHDTVQQPELFEPNAHRDRRNEKALGKRPGEAIKRSEEHTSELQSRENLVC